MYNENKKNREKIQNTCKGMFSSSCIFVLNKGFKAVFDILSGVRGHYTFN